jgi:hypothetical protein
MTFGVVGVCAEAGVATGILTTIRPANAGSERGTCLIGAYLLANITSRPTSTARHCITGGTFLGNGRMRARIRLSEDFFAHSPKRSDVLLASASFS